jgi:EREBP-like factor
MPLHASLDAKLTAICQSLDSKNSSPAAESAASLPDSPKHSVLTEREESVSTGSPPSPTLVPVELEIENLNFTEAPWDKTEAFHLSLAVWLRWAGRDALTNEHVTCLFLK